MSQRHQLSLEILDVSSPAVLPVIDTSAYSDLLAVSCPLLHITPPGFSAPIEFEVEPSFMLSVRSGDLGLSPDSCPEGDLPDGVYVLRYAVAPHDAVWVEYNHLRVTNLLRRYHEVLCDLRISDCEVSSELREQLKELNLIRSFIDAAKAKVEVCHEAAEGLDLFNYAQKKLERFTSRPGCLRCL